MGRMEEGEGVAGTEGLRLLERRTQIKYVLSLRVVDRRATVDEGTCERVRPLKKKERDSYMRKYHPIVLRDMSWSWPECEAHALIHSDCVASLAHRARGAIVAIGVRSVRT